MALREFKSLLLFEKESNYGVDPTPTGAANAFLTSVPQIELLGAGKERNHVMASFGKPQPVNVGEGVKITFDTEFKGALTGTVTPPGIAPLLECCGFTETISSGVSATYAPNSTIDSTSGTIYFYKDGIVHKVSGCRGTFKLNLKTNEIAVATFEFTGLFVNSSTLASDVAIATPTFNSETPQIFRAANMTINSYAAIIENLTFDLGNTITKRPSANATTGVAAYSITQRQIKGSMDPEVKLLATFNPWALWVASTAYTVTWKIGSYITFTMSNCVLEIPKYETRDTLATYALSYEAHPSTATGNDDLSIVFALQS